MYKQLQHSMKWIKGKRFGLFVLLFSMTVLAVTITLIEIKAIPGITIVFYASVAFALLGTLSFWSSLGRISRMKKISTELKQQKEFFRTTLSSISEGLITTGKEGEILYMNPAAESMTGWKNSEAVRQPLEKVFQVSNEETGESVDNIINRIFRHGNPVEWENNTILKSKNAGNIVISNSGSPLLDVNGSLAGAVLVFNDNSGNKVVENKLKVLEKQYRDLIQNLPEAVYTCDKYGHIQLYNKAAVQLWGREPKPGKDLWCGSGRMFNTDGTDLPLDKTPMAICIKEGIPVQGIEILVQRPDESYRHVLSYPTPLYDAYGKLTGAVNMLIDITDKKEREILTKKTEEKYRKIIEQASDAILIYSFDGTIHEFNNSCCTMLGYTAEEYARLKLTDILVGDIIVDKANYAAILSGEAKTIYRSLKRKDGSLVEAEITVKILSDGKAITFARDITERKKAEQALRESELFNRSILSSINYHIAVVEANGNILSVNQAWNDFSVQNGETVLERTGMGSNYFDVCQRAASAGDEWAVRALNGIQQVLRKEIHFFEMEYPFSTSSEQRWFLLRVTNFIGDKPKAVMVHIDITERKKTEEALEQSNKRYELVTRATSDMVWDWDLLTGKVYRSKEGWEKIFKDSGDENGGTEKDWDSRIHPDDLEGITRIKQKLVNSPVENFFEIECRVLRGDGSYAYIHDKGYIIRNEEGKALQLVGASTDITQKKIAEEELKSSEERYRHLFNNNPESIYIWDAESLKILEVNDTAVQEYGYPREEFTQLTILEMRPPEEHDRLKAFVQQMEENPEKNVGIWRHCNKAGEDIYMSIVSDQILYKGKAAVLAIADNVTEKIKLEAKLENERIFKEQEIKEAVLSAQENERQEIGRELHDNINQLLATSRLYLGLVKKETGGSTFMEEADNLIYSAITDIRSLSHSLIPPSVSESALKEALDDIIERTSTTTEIAIQTNFAGFEENTVSGKFKLAIYRIVQEQFNNIIKYAGAKNIYLELLSQQDKIILNIRDDGVGFDTAKKTDGVGLLNIRTRASIFEGAVNISSSPGNGCELKVVFPFIHSSNN